MSAALAAAVLALCPAGTVLGEVSTTSALPWRSLSVTAPGARVRSEASPAHARIVRARMLVTAATEAGVLQVADATDAVLEGARPVADGWSCGPLLSVGASQPYTSDVYVSGANRRLVSVALTYECAASTVA